MNVLDNIDSIFTGTYLHYKDVSKQTMFKSVTERTELRRQKFDEIKRKEQNVSNYFFKAYFTDYQSPSKMYKILSKAENAEINKTRVDLIKKVLTKLKKSIEIYLKIMQLRLKRMKK